MATKLTDAQKRALRGLRDHGWAGVHFHGLAESGGLAGSTMPSLFRKGYVESTPDGDKITEAGLQALREVEG